MSKDNLDLDFLDNFKDIDDLDLDFLDNLQVTEGGTEEKHQEDKPTKTKIQKIDKPITKDVVKSRKGVQKEISPKTITRTKKIRTKKTTEVIDITKKSILLDYVGESDFTRAFYRIIVGKGSRANDKNLNANFNYLLNAIHSIFLDHPQTSLDKSKYFVKVVDQKFGDDK